MEEPPVKARTRRPPSRRLVRHVLRSRVEAVNALAAFFDAISQAGSEKKVNASPHLARMYGGGVKASASVSGADGSAQEEQAGVEGWRYAWEVVSFLKKRGAKIPTLGSGPMEDDWALSSEGEGYTTGEDGEEPVWVQRSH